MSRAMSLYVVLVTMGLSALGCAPEKSGSPKVGVTRIDTDAYTQTIEVKGLKGNALIKVGYETYTERPTAAGSQATSDTVVERMLVRAYQGGEFKKGIILESVGANASIKAFDQDPGELIKGSEKEGFSIDTEFAKVKRFVKVRHEIEVSRCKSSKYWLYAKSLTLEKRGDFLIRMRALLAKVSERNVILSISQQGELTDFVVVPAMFFGEHYISPFKYVSLTPLTDKYILYGKPGYATLSLYRYQGFCLDAYQILLGLDSFQPNLSLFNNLPFDKSFDQKASYRADSYLRNILGDETLEEMFLSASDSLGASIVPEEINDYMLWYPSDKKRAVIFGEE